MPAPKSTGTEITVDVGAEDSDNGKGQQKRILNSDNGLIVATRLVKEYKRWIFLDKGIQKKKEKGDKDKNYRSKRLVPYKDELDELVKQVHNDISELQLTIDGEHGNTFSRGAKMRATIDVMDKSTRTPHSAKEQDNRQRQESSTEQKNKDIAKEESERLNRKIEDYENEKVALILSHKEEIGAHKEENRKDKERYTEKWRKAEDAKNELEKQVMEYTEKWRKAEDAKNELEKQVIELNRKIEEYEDEKVAVILNHKEELGVQKRENIKLKERLEVKTNQLTGQLDAERKAKEDALIRLEEINKDFEHEVKSLKSQYNRLEAKINQLTGQLDAERKAKEDALIRLSSMASNKLRDNNPNIADLSDPNRPTKLSEQFSELYDNEWTDAFDELEKELQIELNKDENMETKIISYLRDILLKIHSMCNDTSSQRLKGIEEAFVKPFDKTTVPTEVFKMIKDALKSMAPYCLEGIRTVVLVHLEETYSGNPVAGCLQHHNVKRYIDKCTDVCWYMSVQDPQVFMDGNKSPNGMFDSNKHREYTKKGRYEEYVVWPVLYLYKDGQMLSKGVAQGKKRENKEEMTEH